MNEEGRKVKYTRRVIREAYFELLREKPITKITIAEICEKADVHRGTFYQHYHDIYALQEKIEAELMGKFDKLLPLLESGQSDLAELTVLAIFEERDMCRAILGENGNEVFLKHLIEKCRNSSYIKYEKANIDSKDFNAVYTFVTAGCVGVIRDWIARDYHETPEYLIEMIRKLTKSGIDGVRKGSNGKGGQNWASSACRGRA
jgi:AcrR family transcriptional regulator